MTTSYTDAGGTSVGNEGLFLVDPVTGVPTPVSAANPLPTAGGVSNVAVALMAPAAQTSTQTSPDQVNAGSHALHVILDVTALAGTTPTVVVTINGKDPASGKYYPLLTGGTVSTASTNVYRIGPALTAATNTVTNDYVPRVFQVVVTIAGTTPSVTYSVGYSLIE